MTVLKCISNHIFKQVKLSFNNNNPEEITKDIIQRILVSCFDPKTCGLDDERPECCINREYNFILNKGENNG